MSAETGLSPKCLGQRCPNASANFLAARLIYACRSDGAGSSLQADLGDLRRMHPMAMDGRAARERPTSLFYAELGANLREQVFQLVHFSFETRDVGLHRREAKQFDMRQSIFVVVVLAAPAVVTIPAWSDEPGRQREGVKRGPSNTTRRLAERERNAARKACPSGSRSA
jgi:hypothetical protein